MDGTYVVRQYDRFDREWIDIESDMTLPEAAKLWDKETKGGKDHTKYEDGHYFDIFPASTVMLFSDGFGSSE